MGKGEWVHLICKHYKQKCWKTENPARKKTWPGTEFCPHVRHMENEQKHLGLKSVFLIIYCMPEHVQVWKQHNYQLHWVTQAQDSVGYHRNIGENSQISGSSGNCRENFVQLAHFSGGAASISQLLAGTPCWMIGPWEVIAPVSRASFWKLFTALVRRAASQSSLATTRSVGCVFHSKDRTVWRIRSTDETDVSNNIYITIYLHKLTQGMTVGQCNRPIRSLVLSTRWISLLIITYRAKIWFYLAALFLNPWHFMQESFGSHE